MFLKTRMNHPNPDITFLFKDSKKFRVGKITERFWCTMQPIRDIRYYKYCAQNFRKNTLSGTVGLSAGIFVLVLSDFGLRRCDFSAVRPSQMTDTSSRGYLPIWREFRDKEAAQVTLPIALDRPSESSSI